MGSEQLPGALLDRLPHRVDLLEVNGASYRLKDAKARRKRRWVPPKRGSTAALLLFIPLAPHRPKRSPLLAGAALLDRHPPHFSTGFYRRHGNPRS